MTRIVAGAAGGRRLEVPGSGTRPTSDRAREGLFSSLAASLALGGARVLDLYAGSGALGLEALSRGAARVVLVESARAAVAVARRNVAAVGIPGAEVVPVSVARYLDGPPEPFDLVLADPPYALPDADVTDVLTALAGRGWLAEGAVVVVERAARGGGVTWPGDLVTPVREKRYGETLFCYGRRR